MAAPGSQRETRNMGSARYRNRMEQRTLDRKLDSLQSHFRCRSSRLLTTMGQLEDELNTMTSHGGKAVVCPRGFTEQERASLRRLRKSSVTPSMTLPQFDVRISSFKKDMMLYRQESQSTDAHGLEDGLFPLDAGIVDLQEHKFCAPLTKHKRGMKEALRRASTGDSSGRPDSAHDRRLGPASSAFTPQLSHADSLSLQRSTSQSSAGVTRGQHRRASDTAIGVAASNPPGLAGTQSAAVVKTRRASASGSNSVSKGKQLKEIVILPDYLAARRKSMSAVPIW